MSSSAEQNVRPKTLIQQNIIVVSAVFVACLVSGVLFSWSVTVFVDRVSNVASASAVEARLGLLTNVPIPSVLGATTDTTTDSLGYRIRVASVKQVAQPDGTLISISVSLQNTATEDMIVAPYEQWGVVVAGQAYRSQQVRPKDLQNGLLASGNEMSLDLDFLVRDMRPIEAFYFQKLGNATRNFVPLQF